jgi:transposase
VAIAVEGCTGWRYVVEEITAAGFEAHVAEPAETQAARGRKKRAKTDRTDARLLRVSFPRFGGRVGSGDHAAGAAVVRAVS